MNETVWTCYGWDTKHDRHVALNYLKEFKHEAYETCKRLHPHVDVFTVQPQQDDVINYRTLR